MVARITGKVQKNRLRPFFSTFKGLRGIALALVYPVHSIVMTTTTMTARHSGVHNFS